MSLMSLNQALKNGYDGTPKRVNFAVFKLYLNKPDFKKKKKMVMMVNLCYVYFTTIKKLKKILHWYKDKYNPGGSYNFNNFNIYNILYNHIWHTILYIV